MKNILITLIALSFGTLSASALEPLIIEPLYGNDNAGITTTAPQNNQGAVADTVTEVAPAQTPKYPPNMIPQNAAAEGLPVVKKQPRKIIIETKQGSRTNTQWNPGGKGTRSYF